MEASEARMAKRSGHAVSGGLEGRRERPATGMDSPETERKGRDVPIAHAIGLPEIAAFEGLPVPGSRAVEASEARMANRSGHAVSGGLEGRRERPATGMDTPETERKGRDVPIAHAIGPPD